MAEIKQINKAEKLLQEIGEKVPQALYPDIYDITNLKLEKNLPALTFLNLKSLQFIKNNSVNVIVNLPKLIKPVDLFLFVNNKKYDMFYHVNKGDFIFRNVKLKLKKNVIESFYRIGNKRSASIHAIIQNKKSGSQNEKFTKH